MGISDADREQVFQCGNALADVESNTAVDTGAMMQLFEIAARLTRERRGNPDNSIMSIYVNCDVEGEKLARAEIAMSFLTMAIAGHETTCLTAGHFVGLIAEHPDQYALLCRSVPAPMFASAHD